MKTQFSARSPQTGKACKLYDFKFLSVGPFQSFALYFLHSPVLGVSIMALLTSSVSENITYIDPSVWISSFITIHHHHQTSKTGPARGYFYDYVLLL